MVSLGERPGSALKRGWGGFQTALVRNGQARVRSGVAHTRCAVLRSGPATPPSLSCRTSWSLPPVEVLFEPEGVRGDSESSAEKRASLAEGAGRSSHSAGFKWHQGAGAGSIGLENELSPTCTARWHNPAVLTDEAGGTRKSQDVVCIAESCGSGGGVRVQGDAAPTLRENRAGTGAMIVCMADAATNAAIDEDMCGTLHVGGDAPSVCL